MLSALNSIRDSWYQYGQDTINIILFVLALFWIFLYGKKKLENNLYLYALLSVLMIFGLQIASRLFLQKEIMTKIYYLLPFALLVSYVGVGVSEQLNLRKNKWIIVVLYAIIIQAGIGLEYNDTYFFGNYNDQKISATVMRMAEVIEAAEGQDAPYLLAPEEIASQIQEYDVNIRVAYGPTYNYEESDIDWLLAHVDEYGCNCLVVRFIYDDEDYIKSKGYRQLIIFDGYSVYYKK